MENENNNEDHADEPLRRKGNMAGPASAFGVGVGVALYSATDSRVDCRGCRLVSRSRHSDGGPTQAMPPTQRHANVATVRTVVVGR
jgi:hypothetical protein